MPTTGSQNTRAWSTARSLGWVCVGVRVRAAVWCDDGSGNAVRAGRAATYARADHEGGGPGGVVGCSENAPLHDSELRQLRRLPWSSSAEREAVHNVAHIQILACSASPGGSGAHLLLLEGAHPVAETPQPDLWSDAAFCTPAVAYIAFQGPSVRV